MCENSRSALMRHTCPLSFVVILFAGFSGRYAAADLCDPPIENVACYQDPAGDTFVRRTSACLDCPVNPGRHPDILAYRIGNWLPYDPNTSLFDGEFNLDYGTHFRMDFVFGGLMNPAGPTGDPLRYGPNPILGHVEFDADNNRNTDGPAGDTDRRQDWFLCNAGRFGFRDYPAAGGYALRTARHWADTQNPWGTPPEVWRTGSEFVFRFGPIPVPTAVEKPTGDADDVFEAGETWVLHYPRGPLWRMPGDFGGGPAYAPPSPARFHHSVEADETTVSLVFPMHQDPATLDWDYTNEASILELLWGLQQVADQIDTGNPAVDTMLAGWRTGSQSIYDYLDSRWWDMRVMVGTCYTVGPQDDQVYVWTDYAHMRMADQVPVTVPGDLTGDAVVDATDAAEFVAFLGSHDGNPYYDIDGDAQNGSLTIPNVPLDFSLYDRNADGIVNAGDNPLSPIVAADLNDNGQLDPEDALRMLAVLLGPELTVLPPNQPPLGDFITADLDADADVDLRDFAQLQLALSAP